MRGKDDCRFTDKTKWNGMWTAPGDSICFNTTLFFIRKSSFLCSRFKSIRLKVYKNTGAELKLETNTLQMSPNPPNNKSSHSHCWPFTVDFQNVLGSGSSMQLVDVLSDDCNLTPLLAESLLTLCYCKVSGVGIFCQHDFTPVVIKLPHARGIPGKGLRSGQFLK